MLYLVCLNVYPSPLVTLLFCCAAIKWSQNKLSGDTSTLTSSEFPLLAPGQTVKSSPKCLGSPLLTAAALEVRKAFGRWCSAAAVPTETQPQWQHQNTAEIEKLWLTATLLFLVWVRVCLLLCENGDSNLLYFVKVSQNRVLSIHLEAELYSAGCRMSAPILKYSLNNVKGWTNPMFYPSDLHSFTHFEYIL